MLQPDKPGSSNGPRKVLDAPIHLASMTTAVPETEDLRSIWINTRDDNLVRKILKLLLLLVKKVK